MSSAARLTAASLAIALALTVPGAPASANPATRPHPRPQDCTDAALAAQPVLSSQSVAASQPPPDLASLRAAPPFNDEANITDAARLASVRQSARSLGLRAAYNRGIWCHLQDIERYAPDLDRMFDFSKLLFPAGGGFNYEPGIVTEDFDNRVIADGGTKAASASARVALKQREALVRVARNWRDYLMVETEPLAPEHPANRPRAGDQRQWEAWVEEGWRRGLRLAGDTMDEMWSRLERDYVGMQTYHRLVKEGRLQPPRAMVTDRGVTGDADEVRVDDVEVETRRKSALEPNPARWRALPFLGQSSTPPTPSQTPHPTGPLPITPRKASR